MLDESKLRELAADIARELLEQKGAHFSHLVKLPEKKQVRVIVQVEDDKLDNKI